MNKDVLKQHIEEYRDLRRNLWLSLIAISGFTSGVIFTTKEIKLFDFLFIIKASIIAFSIVLIYFFVIGVITLNREIQNLLKTLKKEN